MAGRLSRSDAVEMEEYRLADLFLCKKRVPEAATGGEPYSAAYDFHL